MINKKKISDAWERSGLVLSILFLLFASAMLFLAYALMPDTGNEKTRGLLLSAATGTLSGGVFAWLTKIAQFTGVIRGELETVIYGKEHLTNRVDRIQLWLNATRSLYEPRFPDLVSRLDANALKSVLPTEKQFYLKNVRRVVKISLLTDKPGWIKADQELRGTLITEIGSGKIDRTSFFRFDPRAMNKDSIETMIEANKSRYTKVGFGEVAAVDEVSNREDLADGTTEITFLVRLDAGSEYKVAEICSQEQDVRLDNVIGFVAASYVDGLDVEVSYPEEGLILQFHPLGGAEFEDVDPKVAQISKKARNLLFSDAGFSLTMQPK